MKGDVAMQRLLLTSLLALAGIMGLAAEGRADVIVRAPFVCVQVGKPYPPGPRDLVVRTPFVTVRVARPVHLAPPPAPAAPQALPAQPGDPPPVPVDPPTQAPPPPGAAAGPEPARALTVRDFASAFRPAAGTHEVVLVHPRTGKPVPVTFTLPPGTPRKVRATRNALILNYGRREVVTIRFLRDGTVRVRY
jgi:hypothetical protein